MNYPGGRYWYPCNEEWLTFRPRVIVGLYDFTFACTMYVLVVLDMVDFVLLKDVDLGYAVLEYYMQIYFYFIGQYVCKPRTSPLKLSLTHRLVTHALTHALTHSYTHSHTHSFIHSFTHFQSIYDSQSVSIMWPFGVNAFMALWLVILMLLKLCHAENEFVMVWSYKPHTGVFSEI